MSVHRKLNNGTRRLFIIVLGELLDIPFHVPDETKYKGRCLACQRRLPLFFFAVLADPLSDSSSFSALIILNFFLLLKMPFKVDLPMLNWLIITALVNYSLPFRNLFTCFQLLVEHVFFS